VSAGGAKKTIHPCQPAKEQRHELRLLHLDLQREPKNWLLTPRIAPYEFVRCATALADDKRTFYYPADEEAKSRPGIQSEAVS
jgi:hypothetical protein